MTMRRWATLLCVWACLLAHPARAAEVVVFAAASLGAAITEVAERYTAETGQPVVVSAAGSSVLARQIELGAPAAIFVSADEAWTAYLRDGAAKVGSDTIIARNRLVLIAHPRAWAHPISPVTASALRAALGDARIAVALTDAVPAGRYAQAALEHFDLWDDLRGALVEAGNVRAALALVATGAAPFGIVYATDALAEPRVAVIATFPEASHGEIRYPAVLIGARPSAEAVAFQAYLQSPAAQAVFAAHGFRGAPE